MKLFRPGLLLLLGLSNLTFAGPYPIVSSIDVTITNDGALYKFNQYMGYADDWGTKFPVSAGWIIGLVHRHATGNGKSVVAFDKFMKIPKNTTLGEAAIAAYNSGMGNVTSIKHVGPNDVRECIGYAMSATGLSDIPWEDAQYPNGSCTETPPGKDWCKLVSPSLTLDHGTVKLTDQFPEAKGNVRVSCSVGTRAKLYLSGSPYGELNLGGGKATLYGPNGQLNSTGGMMTFEKGDTWVGIRSKLTGVKAGKWQASGTLIIEPI